MEAPGARHRLAQRFSAGNVPDEIECRNHDTPVANPCRRCRDLLLLHFYGGLRPPPAFIPPRCGWSHDPWYGCGGGTVAGGWAGTYTGSSGITIHAMM